MPTIIVSYDGTDNDRDALVLGDLLAGVGASLEIAYVRHGREGERERECMAEHEAQELLAEGATAVGRPDAPQHVIVSGSTAAGLYDLAATRGADLVVFGSEYRTAPGHVNPQATAGRLLDGGQVALALTPAGFAGRAPVRTETVAVVGEDGDPCPRETAESLATALGGSVATGPSRDADVLVIGSKPSTVNGRVTISAAAEYLIELATCPVIVLPRGVAVRF